MKASRMSRNRGRKMIPNHIIVRFGELTTKGKNRKNFTRKLLNNTKEILKDFDKLTYQLTYDHLYIMLNGSDPQSVMEKLKTVFGIHSFSLCYKVEADLEKVKEVAAYIINHDEGMSFKIDTKRNDKNFPMTSLEMNKAIAGYVFHNTTKEELRVDVHHPDILVKVEYRKDYAYVMDNVVLGAGGYPVGIGGKALLMLSGGIDSPVAGYLMMKRGIDIECIHYASPPYTSLNAQEKVMELARLVSGYQGELLLHIVPFTNLQLAIYQNAPESYAITIMRRMMMRIADGLAKKRHALAIATGESIGQVASQTLESMNAINAVTCTPIIRPVVCMDKVEIIDCSKKIGTYETSILPYEDCCTIFTPKNPVTKPRIDKCEKYEQKWDYQQMVQQCIDQVETIKITPQKQEDDLF